MSAQCVRRRFTVDEYHLMARTRILQEDDRLELLEGDIVEIAPIRSRHAACVRRLNRIVSQRVRDRAIVSVQNPVRLSQQSEPQPDLTLLRPRDDFYAVSHPGPEDVLLVVEVADTSEDYDRDVKIPPYARSAVKEAWLVDLAGGSIGVHRGPSSEGYRDIGRMGPGQRLAPQSFPDLSIAVDDIVA